MDGSAWVGLVLLTERGVSSSHPLGRVLVPPIDHLGANIRDFSTLMRPFLVMPQNSTKLNGANQSTSKEDVCLRPQQMRTDWHTCLR